MTTQAPDLDRNYNYMLLKALAKAQKTKVDNFLALSPKHDPFYTGTPGDLANAEWFARLYHELGFDPGQPPHLRRVHYRLVSKATVDMPNGETYENTEKCWDFLTQASKAARYIGLIPFSGLVDNKNPNPHVRAWYDYSPLKAWVESPEIDDPKLYVTGLSTANAQPYHLEIWIEKSTMNNELLPLCDRYGANLVTFEGEVSITAVCVNLMNRIEEAGNKPTRIFYVSDFDPAGNSIPAAMSRKLEYFLRSNKLQLDIKVKPIMLTLEQVQEFDLPRIPIKETELRAGKFEAAFGQGAVELDALAALYPGEFERIVEEQIEPYYNERAAITVRAKRRAIASRLEEQVEAITAKYEEHLEAFRRMSEELAQISIETSDYQVERFEPHVDPATESDWLFDSTRSYLTQLWYYKNHKGALTGYWASSTDESE